jgi:hypothetical protein
MQEIRGNRAFFGFVLLFMVASLCMGLLGEIVNRSVLDAILPPESADWLGYLIVSVIIFFFIFVPVAVLTARQAGKIVGVEVQAAFADRQPPLPFLVMGYSPRSEGDPPVSELLAELDKLGVETVVKPTEEFKIACEKKGEKAISPNRWQQNLRSAWHHREKLKAIYILDPNMDQFEDLKSYLTKAFNLLEHEIEIFRIVSEDNSLGPFSTYDKSGRPIARTYENYEYVYDGLHRGVNMIGARPDINTFLPKSSFISRWAGLHDRQKQTDTLICIDATAGQKIFSIAAAVLTLNRVLKFSYVTTGQGVAGGHVRFYNTNVRIAGSGL